MKTHLTLLLLCGAIAISAQEKGNIAYDRANQAYEGNVSYSNYQYGNYSQSAQNNYNLYLPNDSVYVIATKVMINLQPDTYQAAFGVTQEGQTVAECNKLINDRIENFKNALKSTGVKDEDILLTSLPKQKSTTTKLQVKLRAK